MPNEPKDLTFSQRMGLTPVRKALQIDSMDEPLRNGLWNGIHAILWYFVLEDTYISNSLYYPQASLIWTVHLKRTIDSMHPHSRKAVQEFYRYFFECEWYEVYNFIEFVVSGI